MTRANTGLAEQERRGGHNDRTVNILGVPADLGADRRGVDMGASAVRYAGLVETLESVGLDCADLGNVDVPRLATHAESGCSDSDAKYINGIGEMTRTVSSRVASVLDAGKFPLVLGGDHSVAIGAMRGSAADEEIGVLWFDAHGDYNTPATSPSGNVHGMPLAAIHGHGWFDDSDWAQSPNVREENTVVVGARSLDEGEQHALRDSDVTVFTMSDIDEHGISAVTEEALDVASDGVEHCHVSLDLDWLEPTEAPGVGTPVRGGVTYREAHSALEQVAERDRTENLLRSMDVVEVNPILDHDNATAELAVELTASALGKRIL
jgi:arginase